MVVMFHSAYRTKQDYHNNVNFTNKNCKNCIFLILLFFYSVALTAKNQTKTADFIGLTNQARFAFLQKCFILYIWKMREKK